MIQTCDESNQAETKDLIVPLNRTRTFSSHFRFPLTCSGSGFPERIVRTRHPLLSSLIHDCSRLTVRPVAGNVTIQVDANPPRESLPVPHKIASKLGISVMSKFLDFESRVERWVSFFRENLQRW
jgi:hypothetical protein